MNSPGAAPPDRHRFAAEEPFILAAMLSLVAATVWLNLRSRLLLQFFYSPEMLALTHLVTLGFASSFVQGVMQRLAPRTFAIAPPSRRAGLWQVVLYLLAAIGMVAHFALGDWRGLLWAALLLLASVFLLLRNFAALFRLAWRRERPDWPARWVAASLLHFAAAAVLGCSFALHHAFGLGSALLGAPLIDRLAAHLHLALLGWIGGAIFGYQLKLLPSTRASPRVEAARFGLLQGGLVALVVALLCGAPAFATWCSLPIALSIASRSLPALASWRVNRPGRIELLAHALLLLLAAGGVALAFGIPEFDSDLRFAAELAYGYVGLFGWVVLTVLGTSWKLFSTWVWEERFLPEKGKQPLPPISALPSPLLRDASAAGVLLGVVGVAAAILAGSLPLLRVALALQLLGTLLFVAHFLRIARHALFPSRRWI